MGVVPKADDLPGKRWTFILLSRLPRFTSQPRSLALPDIDARLALRLIACAPADQRALFTRKFALASGGCHPLHIAVLTVRQPATAELGSPLARESASRLGSSDLLLQM